MAILKENFGNCLKKKKWKKYDMYESLKGVLL